MSACCFTSATFWISVLSRVELRVKQIIFHPIRGSAFPTLGAKGAMSSGSYNSVNKDDDDDDEGYGQGQGGYRQFPTPYNDSSQGTSQQQQQQQQQQHQQQQQEGMTPQPSVGRFTEKEKSTTMFSRKPPIPKNYDRGGQAATQSSYQGMHQSRDSASSQSNSGGIVNLRAASRPEDKMNKRKK